MRQAVLEGTALQKSFPGGGELLQSVDLSIYEGDFTVIMGPSGAGKSTLLYAFSGMDSITGGTVRYRGQSIAGLSDKKRASLRAKEFGFVFQQPHLASCLTLFENIAVAGYLAGKEPGKAVRERAERLLRQMGIEGAKDRFPSQVSGGEAQRAAIARAIIGLPGILFADEPTGALNRRSSREVLNRLTGLHQNGQTVLMVTHDLGAAIRGNRILYLEDGRILDECTLPPYEEAAEKEREEQTGEWLSSLRW
ncbi:MAG: ATP-binding cassette domain-containing protein [Provencibacterium sp.]|jgi:ABC-type lipoprotein export system ATPase subunit|nr:ATP-binding cassette domain-containing protein [Provencibacterium sp.]